MTSEERNLITGLFDRLKSADSPQKDQDAVQLIQQSTGAQPAAPYLLVQTVLVQEHALSNAQARIQQLEKQVAEASATASQQGPHKEGGVGGFLSGLFGGNAAGQGATTPAQPAGQPQGGSVPPQRLPQPQAPAQAYAQPTPPPQAYAQATPPPFPSTVGMPPSAGGSFLKSALGTAAGVAGGAALFQGIESLLGHNSGPFGGGGFGHSGFFGGGGGMSNVGYGGPEVVENREVVNNYYDERGSGDQSGGSSFLGGQGVGAGAQEDNRRDDANTNDGGDSGLYSTPPTDNVADSNDSGLYSTPPTDDASGNSDDGLYSTPPTDDNSGSVDNSYDSGNSDAGGGDSSGGNDDTSYV